MLLNPGPTNTRERTKYAQHRGSDVCHRTEDFKSVLEETKELLFNKDPNRIKNLTTLYNGTAQQFKLEFTFVNGENKKVSIPMSARSRSGGLQGKSLFISTSGIKMT